MTATWQRLRTQLFILVGGKRCLVVTDDVRANFENRSLAALINLPKTIKAAFAALMVFYFFSFPNCGSAVPAPTDSKPALL